jgi:hypothetical protein
MQQALAAMIARDAAQTREALQAIENAGTKNFSKEDVDLANSFIANARKLLSPAAISPNQASPVPPDLFGLLASALKDVNQLEINGASQLLDQFIKAQPSGKFAWISEFRPLAQKYLDDCRLYLEWKTHADALPPDKKQLKVRNSAIADAVTGKQRPTAADSPVEAAPPMPARQLSQQEQKDAPQKRSQWLAAWKKRLIDDLNRKQFSGEFTDTSGAQYTGIAAADDQSLSLKLPYGIARVAWNKVRPQTLLTVSASFIRQNAADTADRQWLCAVYASATNQPETARQLAEAAAQGNPGYREQIPFLGL